MADEKVDSDYHNGPILDVRSLLHRLAGSSPGMTRTCDMMVNSHPLYQLSYRGSGLGVRPPTPVHLYHISDTQVKSVPGCQDGQGVDGQGGGRRRGRRVGLAEW